MVATTQSVIVRHPPQGTDAVECVNCPCNVRVATPNKADSVFRNPDRQCVISGATLLVDVTVVIWFRYIRSWDRCHQPTRCVIPETLNPWTASPVASHIIVHNTRYDSRYSVTVPFVLVTSSPCFSTNPKSGNKDVSPESARIYLHCVEHLQYSNLTLNRIAKA